MFGVQEMTQMYERNIVGLRKYFTHLSLAGVTWRFAGKINLVSDTFAEMLGHTKEEMVGRYGPVRRGSWRPCEPRMRM